MDEKNIQNKSLDSIDNLGINNLDITRQNDGENIALLKNEIKDDVVGIFLIN